MELREDLIAVLRRTISIFIFVVKTIIAANPITRDPKCRYGLKMSLRPLFSGIPIGGEISELILHARGSGLILFCGLRPVFKAL